MAPPRSLTQAPVPHLRKGGFVSRKERAKDRVFWVGSQEQEYCSESKDRPIPTGMSCCF